MHTHRWSQEACSATRLTLIRATLLIYQTNLLVKGWVKEVTHLGNTCVRQVISLVPKFKLLMIISKRCNFSSSCSGIELLDSVRYKIDISKYPYRIFFSECMNECIDIVFVFITRYGIGKA